MTGVFTSRLQAVMTTDAITRIHPRMIKLCWRPGCSGMTHITGFAGSNVLCILASSNHIVMTAITATDDLTVINNSNRSETDYRMTGIAVLSSRNVIRCLSHRPHTIVTGRTTAQHLGVIRFEIIQHRKGGTSRCMTSFATFRRQYVIERPSRCRMTVMT